MPAFYIFRLAATNPISPSVPGEIEMKFYHILGRAPWLHNAPLEPLCIEARNPDHALELAIARFPLLRFFLAVQDCASWDATLARLHKHSEAKRAGRIPRETH